MEKNAFSCDARVPAQLVPGHRTSPASGDCPTIQDSLELLPRAVAERVSYVPGPSFFPAGMEQARRHLRLNFSYCGPERIEEGIRRLGAVFARAVQYPAAQRTVK
jgi:DNA-binding transcriptional MocR family regulator